ncbi:hypothetical protein [Thermodesulfatator atlanticus]
MALRCESCAEVYKIKEYWDELPKELEEKLSHIRCDRFL